MPATGSRQTSRTGPAWQTLFNNTYPYFGNKRNRGTIVRDSTAAHPDRQQQALLPQRAQNLEVPPAQNVEPQAQNVEPPAENVGLPAENVEPPAQAGPGIAARAPSPDPATGQNTPEAVQQPVPQGRPRRQNIPRADQRPQNDGNPQGHDETTNLQRSNPHERLNRTNNSGASRHRSRDNNRPRAYPEPLFVRRPSMQGHGEASRRRESPDRRQQRWARDIENSRGRGNARSDARIFIESDIVSNASSSGSEEFMADIVPPVRPLNIDWEMANAYFDTSSTTSAIDDSRESQTGDTEDDALHEAEINARRNEGPLLNNPDSDNLTDLRSARSAHRRSDGDERRAREPLIAYRHRTNVQEPLIVYRGRKKNKTSGRNDTTEGLRGILKNSSSYRRPSVNEANER